MAEEIKKEDEVAEEKQMEQEVKTPEEAENESLRAEIEKLKGDYIRKVAEVENFKKRVQREKEDFMKYSSEKLVIKLLDAVDNLERGIGASKDSKDFDGLVKGVEMTLDQIHTLLDTEGVTPLETIGKEFDPYEHHAMMQEESEEFADNTVMMEFQKGYKMKDKVIRPAMVKVAKNKK